MRIAAIIDKPIAMLAPLLVWGAYFLFVYTLVAIACARQSRPDAILPVLWLVSAATLLLGVAIALVFRGRLRQLPSFSSGDHESNRYLGLRSGWLLSVVVLITIVWTALPILFILPCQ